MSRVSFSFSNVLKTRSSKRIAGSCTGLRSSGSTSGSGLGPSDMCARTRRPDPKRSSKAPGNVPLSSDARTTGMMNSPIAPMLSTAPILPILLCPPVGIIGRTAAIASQ